MPTQALSSRRTSYQTDGGGSCCSSGGGGDLDHSAVLNGAATSSFQFFVYDTELIRSEYDDPASAVIYAHPPSVSPERRLAVAGTLAGVYSFFEQVLTDEVTTIHFEKGGCEVEKSGRVLLLLCRGGGGGPEGAELLSPNTAKEMLDEVAKMLRIYYRGGLGAWADEVPIGRERDFHEKLVALLDRMLSMIILSHTKSVSSKKSTAAAYVGINAAECAQRTFLSRNELRIALRSGWNCFQHMDVVEGVALRRDGEQFLFSTLADVELRVLGYLNLQLQPFPYRLKRVAYKLPSGVQLLLLDDSEHWLARAKRPNSFAGFTESHCTDPVAVVSAAAAAATRQQRRPPPARRRRRRRQHCRPRPPQTHLSHTTEDEDTVDEMRGLLFKVSSRRQEEEEEAGEEVEDLRRSRLTRSSSEATELILYVQSVGRMELMALMRPTPTQGGVDEHVIRDLWNVGLQSLCLLQGF